MFYLLQIGSSRMVIYHLLTGETKKKLLGSATIFLIGIVKYKKNLYLKFTGTSTFLDTVFLPVSINKRVSRISIDFKFFGVFKKKKITKKNNKKV